MRTTAMRRTAMTVSTVSFALLVTACGGGGQSGSDEGTSGKPAAKALTAAQLEKAAVAKGDVKGHEIKKPGKADVLKPDAVSVENAACKPIAQAFSALPAAEPVASVQRLVVQESTKAKKGMPSTKELAEMTEKEAQEATFDSLDITKTLASLWSYDGEGAEQTLGKLREAGKKCAGGFVMTIDGEKQKITKVAEGKLSAGQDGVAWTLEQKTDDGTVSTNVAVIRQGGTLAGFSSFNIAAAARGEAFDQPTAVIDAQAAKLG
ncbi:hypothetical protein [Streptomyces sp. NBC_01304]|uniref:hypothetical protein n=1 Tax=Streptomyces sp. NBC_01304 TaxID=2903818 RepID=UPI002E11F3BC|nr:hypothetical protein OG430_14565 [Streptomyces sp. NBC_01304]